jgi:magnesium transporter
LEVGGHPRQFADRDPSESIRPVIRHVLVWRGAAMVRGADTLTPRWGVAMIDVRLSTNSHGLQGGLPLERISDVIGDAAALLWVDAADPSQDELRLIGEEFGFHHLAMEDAARHHQRPKVDVYDTYLFIVFYSLEMRDERPVPHQLGIFVGSNYLVTVHDGSIPAVNETAARWDESSGSNGNHKRSVGRLVHALLDTVVDDYFPVIDHISDRIDDLEARIFDHYNREAQQEIFALKKDLLAVRRVLAPERDVMNTLLRPGSPVFGEETEVYLQDVYDHILRVTDAVDTYRDLLSSALDAYLSVTSNRLNRTMKTLTASSIILMTMTLVAGVYGMNFAHMPELRWTFGYAWSLGLMAAIGVGLFVVFRRMDWF